MESASIPPETHLTQQQEGPLNVHRKFWKNDHAMCVESALRQSALPYYLLAMALSTCIWWEDHVQYRAKWRTWTILQSTF